MVICCGNKMVESRLIIAPMAGKIAEPEVKLPFDILKPHDIGSNQNRGAVHQAFSTCLFQNQLANTKPLFFSQLILVAKILNINVSAKLSGDIFHQCCLVSLAWPGIILYLFEEFGDRLLTVF